MKDVYVIKNNDTGEYLASINGYHWTKDIYNSVLYNTLGWAEARVSKINRRSWKPKNLVIEKFHMDLYPDIFKEQNV